MRINPSLNNFRKLSEEFDMIAVSTELTADSETPLSAYVKLSEKKPAFLFESVVSEFVIIKNIFIRILHLMVIEIILSLNL